MMASANTPGRKYSKIKMMGVIGFYKWQNRSWRRNQSYKSAYDLVKIENLSHKQS